MPHLKSHARCIGSKVVDLPRQRSVGAVEREDLSVEIGDDPAFLEIVQHLEHARSLGFDQADPDIIRRAMAAGRATFAARQSDIEGHDPLLRYSVRYQSASWAVRHPDVVYYIRNGDLIKIGTSTSVLRRMQTLSVNGLVVVEPGDSRVEHGRHQQFAHLRSHGEWFQLDATLADHLVALRETFEAESGQTIEQWVATLRFPAKSRKTGPRNKMKPFDPIGAPDDTLVSASQAALAVGITRQAIQYWIRTGKIRPASVRDSGRTKQLFRLGDVLRVERAVSASRHSHRHI